MDCSDLDSANNADSTPQNATTVNDFQQNFAQFATNDSNRHAEDSVLLLDVENVAELSETESPMKGNLMYPNMAIKAVSYCAQIFN